ncbi:MAG TPA: efflux RND transporter periplasmic adaptor subunit [Gemmatimonadales bacterium]|nr:efflux RND transporter periplasmic adaptor subunit [Gemmatimonadales bacterium]
MSQTSLVAALVLVLGGCAHKDPGRPAAIPVTAAAVERRSVPYVLTASGTVEAMQRVSVEAQVTGQLLHIGFHEGDDVVAGQVLFEIDPRPFRAALDQAQAVAARDLAQAENAARDAARYAELVKQEYITPQQYQAAVANAAAQAATLRADSAAVETARLNLQYATVRAPISGRAGNLLIREGNLVKGPGNTLVTINQIRPILVRFSVPGSNLPLIQRQPAKDVVVTARVSGATQPETGTLAFVDNAVDTTSGAILLKARFENRDGALWPGEFADVNMQLFVEPNALVVPAVAVIQGQQGSSVFVIDPGDTVSSRLVKVQRVAADLAVIESGLREGERVVTDGQMRLVPGARVEVKTPAVRSPEEAS